MEHMASLWSYQENNEELKQKLLYTTLELESVRVEANEEMRRSREYVKQLLQLLNIACQERDEARDQLHKLLTTPMPSEIFNPIIKPIKPNSSITESNSLSRGSSPVNSLFDPVSSPDMNIENSSSLAFVNQPLVQDYSDQACLVIEKVVKGKSLPQTGKFLQAVLEAGPLLQTLLVAGPLPRWRNPPPVQSLQIPPVSINGCDGEIFTQKLTSNLGFAQKILACGSSQMLSATSVLDFGSGPSGHFPAGKRQKFQ